MKATRNSGGLVEHGVSDLLTHAPKAPGPSLAILDALDDQQFELMGRLSAEAVASFRQDCGRMPDRAELRRIVTLIARAVLAPEAPSYEVN